MRSRPTGDDQRIYYLYKIIERAFWAFQELLEGESRPQKKILRMGFSLRYSPEAPPTFMRFSCVVTFEKPSYDISRSYIFKNFSLE